eukprot:472276-Heterocapsa_arctica.AAC.1
MPHTPIRRRQRGGLQRQSQRYAPCRVLAAAEVRPQAEVVHEVQQLVVVAVPNDGAQDLLQEARSNAVPPLGQPDLEALVPGSVLVGVAVVLLHLALVLVVAFLGLGAVGVRTRVAPPTCLTPLVRGPHGGLAQLLVPVQ